jgi:putative integral membrane protein (TIGR02587 family)
VVRPGTRGPNQEFLVGLSRAFAGALIFSMPILMTMEMWELGVSVTPGRLALLTASTVPLLIALSYYVGFEETSALLDDVLDAFAAYGVAFVTSAGILYVFDVIRPGMPARDAIGRIALQAVPASIGALLAQSELGHRGDRRQRTRQPGYPGQVFFMLVGALFLSFSVAPTEEIQLIAYQMGNWKALGLVVLSLVIMHGFVYGVEFSGTPEPIPGTRWWHLFARDTLVGYATALAAAVYVLWILGRSAGSSVHEWLTMAIVLAFPGAIGAAAARLILRNE